MNISLLVQNNTCSYLATIMSGILSITELEKYIATFRDLSPEMRPLHRECLQLL